MEPVLSELAKPHRVIALDFQGHGRTADINRPITYENLADDVAALLHAVPGGQLAIRTGTVAGVCPQQSPANRRPVLRNVNRTATTYSTMD